MRAARGSPPSATGWPRGVRRAPLQAGYRRSAMPLHPGPAGIRPAPVTLREQGRQEPAVASDAENAPNTDVTLLAGSDYVAGEVNGQDYETVSINAGISARSGRFFSPLRSRMSLPRRQRSSSSAMAGCLARRFFPSHRRNPVSLLVKGSVISFFRADTFSHLEAWTLSSPAT